MAIHGNKISEITINNTFLEHLSIGIQSKTKYISSRYMYDEIGDHLFRKIMNLPEYYLTGSEHEILKTQTKAIIQALGIKKNSFFQLIELGAGDGTKTKELLKPLLAESYDFDYLPIDISQNALNHLEFSLKKQLPKISVNPLQGDYFEVLSHIKESIHPKIILFLGSNLGNLEDDEAYDFLNQLSNCLTINDKIFLGLDLVKSEAIVLPAYNDDQGITASFNLNLLTRINKEFNADFDITYFKHQPEYNAQEGIARSFIVSKKPQEVYIEALNKMIYFKKDEKIYTEISRKYNDTILSEILEKTNLIISKKFLDKKKYFSDYVLTKE
jgi:dimethylhistidine N-methyltransferase